MHACFDVLDEKKLRYLRLNIHSGVAVNDHLAGIKKWCVHENLILALFSAPNSSAPHHTERLFFL